MEITKSKEKLAAALDKLLNKMDCGVSTDLLVSRLGLYYDNKIQLSEKTQDQAFLSELTEGVNEILTQSSKTCLDSINQILDEVNLRLPRTKI